MATILAGAVLFIVVISLVIVALTKPYETGEDE